MQMTPLYTYDDLVDEDAAVGMARLGFLTEATRILQYSAGPAWMLKFDSPEEMALWIEQAKRSGMKFPE